MRAVLARVLFAVALVFFRAAMRLAGTKVYLVHRPALLGDGASARYRRLIDRGEWN